MKVENKIRNDSEIKGEKMKTRKLSENHLRAIVRKIVSEGIGGSNSIKEIIDDALWNADKWMGDDPESMEEFQNASVDEKELMIDESFDNYAEQCEKKYWKTIDKNRKEIVHQLALKMG